MINKAKILTDIRSFNAKNIPRCWYKIKCQTNYCIVWFKNHSCFANIVGLGQKHDIESVILGIPHTSLLPDVLQDFRNS